VDQALWDIAGKRAGMPVYQLLGGKTRNAANVYTHASGRDNQEVEERVRALMELGFRYIRAQVDITGYSTYGAQAEPEDMGPEFAKDGSKGHRFSHLNPVQRPWNEAAYVRAVPRLFDHLRSTLGEEIELLHDIHERVPPIMAIGLAKELERFRLFFLEDPFAPEDIGWFRRMREQTAIPIAMGELFVNQTEWEVLIKDRLIDFIRVHISCTSIWPAPTSASRSCTCSTTRRARFSPARRRCATACSGATSSPVSASTSTRSSRRSSRSPSMS
jgi:mannonate dehydratase